MRALEKSLPPGATMGGKPSASEKKASDPETPTSVARDENTDPATEKQEEKQK